MSDTFEEIARAARGRVASAPTQQDAKPADSEALFLDIARGVLPQPASPAAVPPVAPAERAAQPMTMGRRLAQGVMDPGYGAAQMVANAAPNVAVPAPMRRLLQVLGMGDLGTTGDVNRMVQQREATYQADRQAAGQTGTDWARIGGNVAAALPMAAALPTGGSLLGAAGAGAATGAAMSALQPVDRGNFWEEKGQQALAGGLTGAVTGPAGYAIGRMIAPNVSPGVRRLASEGVEMTPGQVLGGAARRVEDASTSMPLLGDRIVAAQQRSLESFNRSVANRVLRPLGESVPRDAPVGRELVGQVEDRIRAAYQDAFSRAQPFGPDARFAADIQQAISGFLTPQSRQTFTGAVRDRVVSRFQGGQIDAQTFKTIDAELGQMIRTYRGSAIAAEREIGDGFQGVQRALRDLMARSNPEAGAMIRRADAAQAQFVRMQGAATSAGATEGVFTPAQLSQAVRRGDTSVRDRQFARGDALMQELSDAARSALPGRVPDSGTPLRTMINTATLAASGLGGAAGVIPAPALAGAAGLYGLYSRPMTNALQAVMTANRPAPVQALGNVLAGSGGAVAVPLAGMMLSPPEPSPQQRR